MKYKLTKMKDDYFNGNHPNFINEGYTEVGQIIELPKIGKRFYIGRSFSTSLVTEELSKDNIFKTTYSTYKLEKLKS